MIRIENLRDHPQYRDRVIDWLWQEFDAENTREFFSSVIDSSLNTADLPLTFIALQGTKIVGTVGLWRCDLISRQDLTPWLAALYVHPEWRSQGVGQQMQRFIKEYSQAAGYEHLYLWATFSGYYERYGWHYMGNALDYPNKSVRIYKCHRYPDDVGL
ncbi:GNAT family N-acetyltransferase [Rouxiella sp. S1S-2]|uniref:GNAT family N-acetyltransferase n=1 Tax=Rouxiella sp. S1S-2 TaxID=2653856 RepID=UPI001265327C|nr:GNAT family N-acetyltransferase [Rouxiella sp. S1S-2]KAB7895468.1 GNAT family N-acetyltransferase [Rouxiella sp. S1S-2]